MEAIGIGYTGIAGGIDQGYGAGYSGREFGSRHIEAIGIGYTGVAGGIG